MTAWGVTAGCVLLAVVAGACGGDDDPAKDERTTTTASTTTVPERPVTTPSTIYAPDSVEGHVEAAYLASWEVYADAVYHLHLDEAALAEVFAEEHLATKRNEIERRIDEGRAALVWIEHDYTIQLVDGDTAIVVDQYTNHQVLIDPASKVPIEADPNQVISDAVTMQLLGDQWRVVRKDRL